MIQDIGAVDGRRVWTQDVVVWSVVRSFARKIDGASTR